MLLSSKVCICSVCLLKMIPSLDVVVCFCIFQLIFTFCDLKFRPTIDFFLILEFASFFLPGAEIYGRVLVDPVQNLGNSFDANIEKVFLCSGRDGYVPKYDPSRDEYGCLADSPNLRDRFKVLVSNQ